MDPLSQGVLGAIASQNILKKGKDWGRATLIGFIGGMLPDLDIFIRSSSDPLLALEYHRQFTHSLIFIPLGGLLGAILLFPLFKKNLNFKKVYLYCTLGYATHALLDACTTYGTQLLWPFSNIRVSWNNISIIDPLFTLPLLILIILAWLKKKSLFSRLALFYMFFYLLLGVVQRERAYQVAQEWVINRGHNPNHLSVKPSFGNLILWKSIYEEKGRFYIDGVRVGFDSKVYPGESIPKLMISRDLPWLKNQSRQLLDLERFRWFSMDYLAYFPNRGSFVGDIRYSLLPNQIEPLWGVLLDEFKPNTHVQFLENRGRPSKEVWEKFLSMLLGR